jgi:hypothetical protein
MTQQQVPERRKLSGIEQVACAWPLALIAVGGALGGACGAAAWVLNTRIMSSSMGAPMRYALIVLSGIGAIALYFVGVTVLAVLFPNLFGAR